MIISSESCNFSARKNLMIPIMINLTWIKRSDLDLDQLGVEEELEDVGT